MRKILLATIALLLLLICLVIGAGVYVLSTVRVALVPTPDRPLILPTVARADTPTATLPPFIPTLGATSTPPLTNSTLDRLIALEIPSNDPLQLVPRLKKTIGALATPATPTTYRVGDRASFWVTRDITGTYQLITATLKYITPHSYMWLEDGEAATASGLKSAGDTFENEIYPTNRKFFGSEPTPGVDNDPHIYILNTRFNGAIGYFSAAHEYPPFVNRFSNQHEMFYMNVRAVRPGTQGYASTLAHEFAHMIHWNQNRREGSWITEGFGDLAIKLNNLSIDRGTAFSGNPDLQLNSWQTPPSRAIPNYNASYLFLAYCLNRFGAEFLRDVMASGTHDILSIQTALDIHAPGLKFDDVFGDWVIANFINDSNEGARFSYLDDPLEIRPTESYSRFPARGEGTVHQYGTDYIQLQPGGADVSFTFEGDTQVKAVPPAAHSGKFTWWSNRTDESDTSLTREFDLTAVQNPTLTFWTWHDIEDDFDYAYVEVSTDSGKTWTPLAGNTTTTHNPNDSNYGNGITCKSGVGCGKPETAAQWVQEEMDLAPYAGQKILLRFEYITDAIYSGPGMIIDDIRISELNFTDDAEESDNGWEAQGFARIDNTLPQRFLVQAIEFGQNTRVVPIELDAQNQGTYKTNGFGSELSRVVIAISGSTPITWEQTHYSFSVR